MFFSPSTCLFYPIKKHQAVPSDVVEVSDETFRECLAAREQNKLIVPDANGRPVAIDRVPQ